MEGQKRMELPATNWFDDEEYWSANRHFIWSEKRIEMSAIAAERISTLLEMKPGESVLDLACGFGRHSIPLAKLGFNVTGIDLNQSFIKEASEKANEQGLTAKFECVDMRKFKKPEKFENVIITYNSFGYFENPNDDRIVIRNCYQSLKPGGKLLLQDVTREWIATHRTSKVSRYWFENSDGSIRLEETSANDDWTWNTTRWILIKGSERREYTYGMRIYSAAEYIDLLSSEGFENPQSFGGFSGKSYEEDKDHLILVVEKPKR